MTDVKLMDDDVDTLERFARYREDKEDITGESITEADLCIVLRRVWYLVARYEDEEGSDASNAIELAYECLRRA